MDPNATLRRIVFTAMEMWREHQPNGPVVSVVVYTDGSVELRACGLRDGRPPLHVFHAAAGLQSAQRWAYAWMVRKLRTL